MLIKTIAELKAMIPRLSQLSNTSNLPNFSKAGRKYIKPVLGAALYKSLDDKYNSSDALTEKETDLLKAVQLPLAALTLLDDLPFIHTIITDNGIRTATSQSMETAHKWEVAMLKDGLMEYAADGMEQLLNYLFDNKEEWTEWTDSNEYKELNDFLIKSGSEFQKYYPLKHPLRTYWALRPIMSNVDDNYLLPTFGGDLLAWLKSEGSVMVRTKDGLQDVVLLLKKAVAYFTIKHAGEHMAVQFDRTGFTVPVQTPEDPEQEGSTSATRSELKFKVDAADREGQ
ncbi:MAG: DUF6712 family protein, partial [Pseudobacter sp.]|uniref:DUF6712 family protein n=1 Tax=Pseudobacter sp. TaxID=2045420 RepID=UPI003F7D007E